MNRKTSRERRLEKALKVQISLWEIAAPYLDRFDSMAGTDLHFMDFHKPIEIAKKALEPKP